MATHVEPMASTPNHRRVEESDMLQQCPPKMQQNHLEPEMQEHIKRAIPNSSSNEVKCHSEMTEQQEDILHYSDVQQPDIHKQSIDMVDQSNVQGSEQTIHVTSSVGELRNVGQPPTMQGGQTNIMLYQSDVQQPDMEHYQYNMQAPQTTMVHPANMQTEKSVKMQNSDMQENPDIIYHSQMLPSDMAHQSTMQDQQPDMLHHSTMPLEHIDHRPEVSMQHSNQIEQSNIQDNHPNIVFQSDMSEPQPDMVQYNSALTSQQTNMLLHHSDIQSDKSETVHDSSMQEQQEMISNSEISKQHVLQNHDTLLAHAQGLSNKDSNMVNPQSNYQMSEQLLLVPGTHMDQSNGLLNEPSHSKTISSENVAPFSETMPGCHGDGPPPEMLTTSRKLLEQNAQCLINDINIKRKENTQVISDFKQVLHLQVENTCSSIEESMFNLYNEQGKIMQKKLQELFATLDHIAVIEDELKEFKAGLSIFCKDLNN